jgi:hypothetical protein
MRTDDVPPTVPQDDGTDTVGRHAPLLQARRKFIQGSVGVSAFVATLANRPAFANDGWASVVVQNVCSVVASHQLSLNTKTGSCYHPDYHSCNQNHWVGCSPTTKFSNYGWTPTVATCGFSNDTFWNKYKACYTSTGTGKNIVYKFNGSASQINACWFACAFVNASISPSNLGYTCSQLAAACTAAFQTPNCSGGTSSIATQLCSVIKSICTQGSVTGGINYSTYSGNPWCWAL